jgi:cytochrome b
MLKTRFGLDVVNFTFFLIALEPHFTGDSLHEWIAMALAASLIVHFLFHWDWFIRIAANFLKNPYHISRLNHVLAIFVFIGFTIMITSGLMISDSFLPTFGLHADPSRGWKSVHELAANLTLVIVALHFALHWDWVKNTFVRVLVNPFRKDRSKKTDKTADHA